jgi:hypothetical protein
VSPFEVSFDTSAFEALIRELGSKSGPALARAINRSTDSGRTHMVRLVSKDTGISSSAVRKEVQITKATPNSLVSRITIKGRRLPLIAFSARGPEPSRGRGRGVSYRLPTGRGRISDAFIATMPTGHRGVFKRTGKPRLPIQQLYGPSLPHVFRKYLPELEKHAKEVLPKNVKHELEFALSKLSKGGA